jgi:hypothetical protein
MSAQVFRFDASVVSSRLATLEACTAKVAERAMALAGLRLLRDSIMEMPTVPRDTGTLRGSGSVLVQNKHFMSADPVGGNPTPATAGDAKLGRGEIVAQVGFNTPYAAYQHEGVRMDGTRQVTDYTEPGSGSKFLERPLLQNAAAYKAIIGKAITEGLRAC